MPGAGARLRGTLLGLLIAAVPLTGSAQQNQADGSADPKAEALLRQADEVRFPLSGAELTVSTRTTKNGQETDRRVYRVLSKGNDRSVVMVIEPQIERGQVDYQKMFTMIKTKLARDRGLVL